MSEPISWRNPKVLRVLLLVFVAGGLSGAVTFRTARMLMRREVAAAGPAAPTSLQNKEKALQFLTRELNLSPVQSDQVASIIDDYKRYYGNIQDQVEELRATGKNHIREVLNADQRAKFEKFSESLK